MSVRPGKNHKIFCLYEDSLQNFKGRYFKIFPVDNHCPFWLSLEGEGRFPSHWSDQACFDIVSVTYQRLNAEQKDTTDILVHLFSKNNLAPKSLLSNLEEAQRVIVEMASNNVTLARLCNLLRPAQLGSVPTTSGPSYAGRRSTSPLTSPKKRPVGDSSIGVKRPRVFEGGFHEFSAMDRSFNASGFVEASLLGPRAQEALRDYDPIDSVRWAQWAILRSATIMKFVEPCLTMVDEVERRNNKVPGDLKVINLQKVVLEEEKAEAIGLNLRPRRISSRSRPSLKLLGRRKKNIFSSLSVEKWSWLWRLRNSEV
ncbi:hypothetical protein PIB30_091267 [Stylosanthes scabra]|uniref:Uncharacterized protein n=1 Tax=Stylosanthes scabra TaxID=79078 RepID=A0ABU6UTB0_9FABA|nr:hypothetical protein [Stylosanthes scabra]